MKKLLLIEKTVLFYVQEYYYSITAYYCSYLPPPDKESNFNSEVAMINSRGFTGKIVLYSSTKMPKFKTSSWCKTKPAAFLHIFAGSFLT